MVQSQDQEKGISSILEEMAEIKTRKGEGMLSVSVPKAVMLQFQLFLKVTQ